MAAHLREEGSEPGDRVAILSKNCAHFFNRRAGDLDRRLLDGGDLSHRGPRYRPLRARAQRREAPSFIGKLDAWKQQQTGVPDGVARDRLPLAPKTDA